MIAVRPKKDFVVKYLGYFRAPAEARVIIFDRAKGSQALFNETAVQVVLYTAPSQNYEGMSVSNGSERIATELFHEYGIEVEITEYVEYYPPDKGKDRDAKRVDGGESYAAVEYGSWKLFCRYPPGPKRLTAQDRGWAPVKRKDFEQLIGGEFPLPIASPHSECATCSGPIYPEDGTIQSCVDCGEPICPTCEHAVPTVAFVCTACRELTERRDNAPELD